MISEKKILMIAPVLTHNIWGGTKLRNEYHYQVIGDDIGECWGIAAHRHGDCIVANGRYEGVHLSELWENHPELFGKVQDEVRNCEFPLLIKIIDANDNLSIQVHPDNTYANMNENGDLGKSECWYILDCEEGSELVIGHNATTRQELEEMVQENRWNDLIKRVPISKGDFIQINPGTVHAITKGVMVLETQQSCDITYRLYDYDRLQNGEPRELHIKKSLDVITVPAQSDETCIVRATAHKDNELFKLFQCDYYTVYILPVNGECKLPEGNKKYALCSVIDGDGMINGESVKKGSHFIIPVGMDKIEFEGNMQLVISTE